MTEREYKYQLCCFNLKTEKEFVISGQTMEHKEEMHILFAKPFGTQLIIYSQDLKLNKQVFNNHHQAVEAI